MVEKLGHGAERGALDAGRCANAAPPTNDHGCCPQMRAAMGDSVVAGHLLHLSASTLDSGRRLPRAGLGACQLSDLDDT